jgi:hypothetical protein
VKNPVQIPLNPPLQKWDLKTASLPPFKKEGRGDFS